MHLDGNGVGVDTSQASVDVAANRGCVAYTVEDFADSGDAVAGGFESLLLAHVLEHMPLSEASDLVQEYLPYVTPGGQVIVIVPQEAGYATDDTHINFLDSRDVTDLMKGCGLVEIRDYSFPFPRRLGKVFRYNETVVVGHLPAP